MPKLIRLRVTKDRGLLLTSWINGKGPYVFAVDTGAGKNLVTQRVVSEAQLPWRSTRRTTLGGLTSAATVSNREVVINELALGEMRNTFGAKTALVVSLLAPGIDGILDPTDIYSPYGYSIDMPNQRLAGLETTTARGLRPLLPGEGAVVPWLHFEGSARPFVRLGDGRLALIDTGSGFGLAVNERDAVIVGPRRSNQSSEATLDVAGGTITSQRVAPTTITIGDLVLRRVPTDILFGVSDDAPAILGRDVLYPFKITFDPQRRSIEFHTSEKS
jgi:predicted aspartyl protease